MLKTRRFERKIFVGPERQTNGLFSIDGGLELTLPLTVLKWQCK